MATMRRWGRLHVALATFFAGATTASWAQERIYDAGQVKAAFLYHFSSYAEWPTQPSDDPITIAVLGDRAVAAQLAEFLPGRRIDDRPVEVRSIGRVEELGDEELLYIGSANNGQLAAIIDAVGRRPVLVVSDSADGLDRGAMINFQLVDSRVRFEISASRAEGAGIRLSSRLLSAASRVVTGD